MKFKTIGGIVLADSGRGNVSFPTQRLGRLMAKGHATSPLGRITRIDSEEYGHCHFYGEMNTGGLG